MTTPDPRVPAPQPTSPRGTTSSSRLAALDAWMAAHPWHPRLLPFLAYVCCLPLLNLARDYVPVLYPALYAGQCLLVAWLLWRYRRLLPELTFRFHWLAVPVGVGVFLAWVGLGWWMAGEWPQRWAALQQGQLLPLLDYPDPEAVPPFATAAGGPPLDFRHPAVMGPVVGWLALGLRLLGMSLLVPVFEELFIRSLLLRSFHSFRQTGIGLVQVLQDLPLIGEWLMHTDWGLRAERHPPVFAREFAQTPLGRLSWFGVTASTLVFVISHLPRDWPGTVVCGLAYCGLLAAATRNGRRPEVGLGSVIWAHGVTNALLWVYTLQTGDWQFL